MCIAGQEDFVRIDIVDHVSIHPLSFGIADAIEQVLNRSSCVVIWCWAYCRPSDLHFICEAYGTLASHCD
jgi:hypothetical protein